MVKNARRSAPCWMGVAFVLTFASSAVSATCDGEPPPVRAPTTPSPMEPARPGRRTAIPIRSLWIAGERVPVIRAVVLLVGTLALLACAADPLPRSKSHAATTRTTRSGLDPEEARWCAEAGAVSGCPGDVHGPADARDGSSP
jgi:hypothetical protein